MDFKLEEANELLTSLKNVQKKIDEVIGKANALKDIKGNLHNETKKYYDPDIVFFDKCSKWSESIEKSITNLEDVIETYRSIDAIPSNPVGNGPAAEELTGDNNNPNNGIVDADTTDTPTEEVLKDDTGESGPIEKPDAEDTAESIEILDQENEKVSVKRAYVSTESTNLNVRDENGNIITSISNGTELNVIGTTEDGKTKIEWGDGEVAYVSSKYVNNDTNMTSSSSIETASTTPFNNFQATVSTNNQNLNVRSGPGMNNDVISTYQNGTNITIIGQEGNWYKVDVDGTSGYVYKDYITELGENNE